MTFGWARDFALELMNQYSMAGAAIPESYNNQADYVKRAAKLVDDAQVFLATNEGRMRAVVPLEELEKREMGAWTVYKLPEDCWQMCAGGLIRMDGPTLHRYTGYRLLGGKELAVYGGVDGDMALEYFRYPRLLGEEAEDHAELDNTVAAQQAVPYYVAAHLVMYDDQFAYAALLNEFGQRRALLRELPRAEAGAVEDAYDAAEWEYLS